MLHLLTDAKNLAVGTLQGGLDGAGRWGTWAMGWHGDRHDSEQRFQRFNVGGLILPSIAVGLVNPGLGLALYFGGMVASAAAGGAIGAIAGGYREVSEGVKDRRYQRDQLNQQRDQARMQEIQNKLQKAHGNVEKAQATYERKAKPLKREAEKIQERMEKRQEKGGFVEKEMARRAGGNSRGRG